MSEAPMTSKTKIALVVAGVLIGFLVFWIANGRVPPVRFPGTPGSVGDAFGTIFFGFLLGLGFHFAGWLLGKVLK